MGNATSLTKARSPEYLIEEEEEDDEEEGAGIDDDDDRDNGAMSNEENGYASSDSSGGEGLVRGRRTVYNEGESKMSLVSMLSRNTNISLVVGMENPKARKAVVSPSHADREGGDDGDGQSNYFSSEGQTKEEQGNESSEALDLFGADTSGEREVSSPKTPKSLVPVGGTIVGENGYYATDSASEEWQQWMRRGAEWRLVDGNVSMKKRHTHLNLLKASENTKKLVRGIPYYDESRDTEINDIVDSRDYNADYIDNQGNNLLMLSVTHKQPTLVRAFVNQGIDVNTQNDFSCTALHIACYGGSLLVENVQILLNAGAYTDLVDANLCTPLHYAAAQGSASIVALLIAQHARVDQKDSQGKTCLDYAEEAGHAACIHLINASKACEWKACSDPATGYTYWENLATGECQWHAPQAQSQAVVRQQSEAVGDAKERAAPSSKELMEKEMVKRDKENQERLEKLQEQLEKMEQEKKALEEASAKMADEAAKEVATRIKELETSISDNTERIKSAAQEEANRKLQQKIKDLARKQEEEVAIAVQKVEEESRKQQQFLASRQEDRLRQLQAENCHLKNELTKEQQLRKLLHNRIEDMKGKIRVYCRIRPAAPGESAHTIAVARTSATALAIEKSEERIGGLAQATKGFDLDAVFSPEDSQETVFDDVKRLVQSAFDGYNVCIFAYGQTGSGKTYTMSGSQSNPGLIPRAVDELFRLASVSVKQVTVSLIQIELYCDKLVDLQSDMPQEPPVSLDVRQKSDGRVVVPGATEIQVKSSEHMKTLMENAVKRRAVSATEMNEASSRSHMLSIIVVKTKALTGQETVSKLTLVDLAGSERMKKTHAKAQQIKEAQSINQSLSALGNVVRALAASQKSKGQGHIPFRDNKLTLLMSDSLGGTSKTLMLVCVSPADYNVSETESSLLFATRVKQVRNKA